jgi:hypothetical protein
MTAVLSGGRVLDSYSPDEEIEKTDSASERQPMLFCGNHIVSPDPRTGWRV